MFLCVLKILCDNPILQHDNKYNEMIIDCDDTDKILNYGDVTMIGGVNYNSIGSPKTS